MSSLGLLGFGRFGQLIYKHLKKHIDISIYDTIDPDNFSNSNLNFKNLANVCQSQFIVLAVPVSHIESLSKKIASYLKPGTVVIDVCAVKKYPLQILQNKLPTHIEILGSHPLFGPDSATDSLEGHKIILSPLRINKQKYQLIRDFLEKINLRIVEMSPEKHDHLMAWTLSLTHFLGRGLSSLPLPEHDITTMDYQNLRQLIKKVDRDTWELFEDMHLFNPYTAEVREKLLETLTQLKDKIELKKGQSDLLD